MMREENRWLCSAEQRQRARPACTGPGGGGGFDARLFDSVRIIAN
jgi:hypothetical protein